MEKKLPSDEKIAGKIHTTTARYHKQSFEQNYGQLAFFKVCQCGREKVCVTGDT